MLHYIILIKLDELLSVEIQNAKSENSENKMCVIYIYIS